MKKIIYACGDSFVYGAECIDHGDISIENKKHAFPEIIKTILGYDECINGSYCGASNEFIFRKTIEDLELLEKSGVDLKSVLVIVGITSLVRIEIDSDRWFESLPVSDVKSLLKKYQEDSKYFPRESEDFNLLFVNPNSGFVIHNRASFDEQVELAEKIFDSREVVVPWCAQYLWTDLLQVPQQEARVLALQGYFENKGCKYVFINSTNILENTSVLDLSNKNLYKINSESFSMFGKNNFPKERRTGYHFSSKVHEKYAEILSDYVTKNII
jgi:hypothetical protein